MDTRMAGPLDILEDSSTAGSGTWPPGLPLPTLHCPTRTLVWFGLPIPANGDGRSPVEGQIRLTVNMAWEGFREEQQMFSTPAGFNYNSKSPQPVLPIVKVGGNCSPKHLEYQKPCMEALLMKNYTFPWGSFFPGEERKSHWLSACLPFVNSLAKPDWDLKMIPMEGCLRELPDGRLSITQLILFCFKQQLAFDTSSR